VTSWSKLDTTWRGVSLDVLLAALDYDARYVLAYCDGGYTTNMPAADLTGGRAWVAFGYGGNPLGPEHGGPARLLVPHLYFWKSAKWVRGLRLRDTDEPGFWENYGYHMYSRPMARTAVRGRLTWQTVAAGSVISETPTARTVVIDVPGWPGHRAGQHDLRPGPRRHVRRPARPDQLHACVGRAPGRRAVYTRRYRCAPWCARDNCARFGCSTKGRWGAKSPFLRTRWHSVAPRLSAAAPIVRSLCAPEYVLRGWSA
jgi:Oxidoreductase molybdopterin binding domain